MPFLNFEEDFLTTEDLLFMAGASGVKGVEDTATGNPVTFLTDLAKPLKSLIANFLPIQSGTGDPSPTNIRPITGWTGVNVFHAGKNLANLQYGNKVPSVSTGQMVNSNGWSTPFIPIDTSKNYYLSRGIVIGNIYVMFYGSDYSFIRAVSTAEDVSINTLNGFSECSFIKLRNDSASTATMDIQLEEGTSASAYEEPNTTVYPVTFPALGKNLSKFVNGKGIATDGTIGDSANRTATVEPIPIESGISYIFTFETGYDGIYSVFNDNTLIRRAGASNGDTLDTSNGNKLYVCVYKSGDTATWESAKPMVRKSTESAGYEPFNNTIYGGFVDFVTGVLTVTQEIAVIDSSNSTIRDGAGYYGRVISFAKNQISSNNNDMICSHAVNKGISSEGSNFRAPSNGAIWISLPSCATVEGAQSAIDAGDIQVIYNLRSPKTYQLTPQQINAIKGNNTVWSDANGDCEVTYLKKG